MENRNRKAMMEVHTLLRCGDAQYLRTISRVLKPLGVAHTVVEECPAAMARIAGQKFEAIIVDGREIDNLAEFQCAVRRSH